MYKYLLLCNFYDSLLNVSQNNHYYAEQCAEHYVNVLSCELYSILSLVEFIYQNSIQGNFVFGDSDGTDDFFDDIVAFLCVQLAKELTPHGVIVLQRRYDETKSSMEDLFYYSEDDI